MPQVGLPQSYGGGFLVSAVNGLVLLKIKYLLSSLDGGNLTSLF